nr:hypothetical protein [Tanacetum cinerariifolium]
DLLAVDMKEILQQRMFEDNSYKAHDDHKNLFEALQNSLERNYSNQLLADLDKAHKKKRKKHDLPRTPFGGAPSSSKTAASTPQSMAWTTSDTRYESAGFAATQETSPTDYLMNDVSIPDEQVHLSDDKDTENDHLPKADMRKDWWKPLPEEERPATPKPAWTIPSSNTGDMTTFMNWYCQKVNKTVLTQADFEGHAYEVVKVFYPNIIHLQFQMEECHKMLIDHINWVNPKGDQVRIDVLMNEVKKHMRILSVVKIKAFSRYGYDYLSKIVLRRADFQEHKIAEKDFKNMYLSDFEYLDLLLLQDLQLDSEKHDYTITESPRAVVFSVNNNERKIMRFNEMYNFSDVTLTRILEALDYRVNEYMVNQLNPGMNMQFWTYKDVSRSKEFISAIEWRLKTRRIFCNLECFVGGRVSLRCSANTTKIIRRTIMITLVFTLCEEQVIWNSILMRFIDDLLALDSIVRFGFSDQRLEQTATFSISTNSE